MIELDGIEYQTQTPTEVAYDMINYINQYCATNNITNSKGEVIYIDVNPMNPLYMICFGLGYLVGILQKLIYSVGCAFNFNAASEKQLLNLAEIANVKRIAATKTTIECVVYAVDSKQCTITKDLSVTVTSDEGIQVIFHPGFELTVPAMEAGKIILIAETYGSYNVSAGAITQFDTDVDGFDHMTSNASIPGQDQETISAFRKRLQTRTVQGTNIDKAAEAIMGLDGVSLCNIYFNYDTMNSETINGIVVPPRRALLMVQGYSNKIAETFFTYLSCLTAGESDSRALVQYYTTRAAQRIPVYMIAPITVPVYIRLYISSSETTASIDDVISSLLALSANLSIAQDLSTADIINNVHENFPDVDIESAQLSRDGESYYFKITPTACELLTLSRANFEVVNV